MSAAADTVDTDRDSLLVAHTFVFGLVLVLLLLDIILSSYPGTLSFVDMGQGLCYGQ